MSKTATLGLRRCLTIAFCESLCYTENRRMGGGVMMKKILIVSIAVVVAIALILFVPVPIGPAKDGGTRQYAALTYRIVVWNRFVDQTDADGQLMTTVYHNTSVYWYPDNRKTVDELWEMEMEHIEEYVSAVTSPQEPITIA